MRAPPDPKRKAPRRLRTDAEQIRNNKRRKLTRADPIGSNKISIAGIAAQLRDDGYAPIAVRLAGLRAAHRLRLGGSIERAEEQTLLRLYVARRRAASAAAKAYRVALP